jgi:hypothetical protein
MKPKYYIYCAPKGSLLCGKKKYFFTYTEAVNYIESHFPTGAIKGMFHIYPVDKSGYFSKADGRTSFGEGNKDWGRK